MDFNRVDGFKPNNAWTLKARGMTKRVLKDLEGSLVDLDRVDGVQPSNVWTLRQRRRQIES